jgi:hypothetical protein
MAAKVSGGEEVMIRDGARANGDWVLGWVRIHTEEIDLDSGRGRRLIATVRVEEGECERD